MTPNILNITSLALFALSAILSVVAIVKARRTKGFQDKAIQSLERGSFTNWFRVRISRPAYFRRRLKLVGFETSGVVVNTPDSIRILAEFGGEKYEKVYTKDDLQLEWIGNPGLGSANMYWIAIGRNGDNDRMMISADTGFNAVQSREATADICRMIDPAFQLPGSAIADFALEKNKASLLVMGLFAVLSAFALVDGVMLNTNELIRFGNLRWALPVLVVFALPAYLFMTRNCVPSRESLALSMLLVTSIVLAAIPLAKRADQLLAHGATNVEYTLTGDARFEAVDPGPPSLNFREIREYWAQFEEGSTHSFRLIHGPLGLWQLERAELNEKTRQFYQDK